MFKQFYSHSKTNSTLLTAITTSTLGLSSLLLLANNHNHNNNATTCSSSSSSSKIKQDQEEEKRSFQETLQHHKQNMNKYKQAWDYQNVQSRIPTTSWPLNIPSDTDLPSFNLDLQYCQKRSNPHDTNQRYCTNLQFRIASYYLLQPETQIQTQGLKLIQSLAEVQSHPDSICAYATCLNDGRGGLSEPNPSTAFSWWKHAADKYHHIQSMYECGVALYTGEGVAEDEELAVQYFRNAAECGHAGASYMLGDCLLDGVGVERDRGEALEWLVTAAELGHRGARSRVLAVLERKEGGNYGEFTDASRQTLISSMDNDDDEEKDESGSGGGSISSSSSDDSGGNSRYSGTKRDDKERLYSNRPVTLEHRFTIGGGARNPVVLARRRTIVSESRQHE